MLRKDDASLKDNLDDVNNSSNLVLSFTFEEVKEIFLIFFKKYNCIEETLQLKIEKNAKKKK